MASVLKIRKRLKSVWVTRKITNAMKLVASSKLKKSFDNFSNVKDYAQLVNESFGELINALSENEINDSLNLKAKQKNSLNIIITSDLGLCGSYNSKIFKLAKSEIKSDDYNFVFGTRGSNHFKNLNLSNLKSYSHLGDAPKYYIIKEIMEEVIALIQSNEVNEVKVFSTKFINSITFEANLKTIFPFHKNDFLEFAATQKESQALVEFEPNPVEILFSATNLYLGAIIYQSIYESKVSEISARFVAMESATDNADEIFSNLKVEYNQARQKKITQEINEIVAGANI